MIDQDHDQGPRPRTRGSPPSSLHPQRRLRSSTNTSSLQTKYVGLLVGLSCFCLYRFITSVSQAVNRPLDADEIAQRLAARLSDQVAQKVVDKLMEANILSSSEIPQASTEFALPQNEYFGTVLVPYTPQARTFKEEPNNSPQKLSTGIATAQKEAESLFGSFFSSFTEATSSSNGPHPILSLPNYHQTLDNRRQCLDAIRNRQKRALRDVMNSMQIPRVLLVDPAYHKNVGDTMLSRGEHAFFESYGWSKDKTTVFECDILQGNGLTQPCSTVLPELPNDVKVAFWHAGGNWGDLWDPMQDLRIESFEELLQKNMTIIGMPQSFHYNNQEKEVGDVEKMKDSIARGLGVDMSTSKGFAMAKQRVFLAWREHESYEKAVRRYPFVQNRLMPDIALQLGPYEPIPSSSDLMKDIMLLLREDHESKSQSIRDSDAIREALDKIPGGKGTTFALGDWWDRIEWFDIEDTVANNLFTSSSLQLLSLGKILIADRLHATILAYLSGIPVIYVDQKTKKISRTFGLALQSWEGCKDSDKSMVFEASNVEQALVLAVEFLKRYKERTS